MPYKFMEDVAWADIAFEATGRTLAELFESAALAVTNTMVRDLNGIHTKTMKRIEIEGRDVENLLFNFLQELVFLKDAELLLFSKIKIEDMTETSCTAVLRGEKINPKKHSLIVDVKAVTMHMFKVERTSKGWRAQVILDV
ncbi:MAG: archease [Candidatus Aenigmarchaeota archaeon]|nr:archease [Candidatus Aenigmarchaeota archaeon]